ncbi:MAG TPA: class II aldolase/adducin family protein, partial [Hyphomicrobiales bacterium]|nr:class II aldolase/adducin family protein [Hyphomicrobiales bacterium]
LHAEGVLDYSGHIGARLPDNSGILIQGFKDSRDELTPDQVLTVDWDGSLIEGREGARPPSETVIHTAILKARPDIGAVLHCHPPSAILFTLIEGAAFVPMKNHAIRWRDGVPEHSDPGHISSQEQGAALAATLGEHNACLLRAHGAVLVAEDPRALLIDGIHFEENATALRDAMAIGSLRPLTEAECEMMASTFRRDHHISKLWAYYVGRGIKEGVLPESWRAAL